ncbi:MAG: hypothetical protein PHY48_14235 [Candidatus Cloacimonetes bacterium]|nr:hypothetical protein [Candidatus Cloacimonadota bacterium]
MLFAAMDYALVDPLSLPRFSGSLRKPEDLGFALERDEKLLCFAGSARFHPLLQGNCLKKNLTEMYGMIDSVIRHMILDRVKELMISHVLKEQENTVGIYTNL